MLAAAAAVVLAIGGGYLVTQQLGVDPQPTPPTDQTDAADREPVEQEHVYAADEMPSLLGYTTEEATELLESRGYPLRVEAEYSCDQPAGYVARHRPGSGHLRWSRATRCACGSPADRRRTFDVPRRPNTWQQVLELARFARGLGTALQRFPVTASASPSVRRSTST